MVKKVGPMSECFILKPQSTVSAEKDKNFIVFFKNKKFNSTFEK